MGRLTFALLAGVVILILASCGGSASSAIGSGEPRVRTNDYRLYEIPGGKVIVCIGWGHADQSGATITCDWDHPLDR